MICVICCSLRSQIQFQMAAETNKILQELHSLDLRVTEGIVVPFRNMVSTFLFWISKISIDLGDVKNIDMIKIVVRFLSVGH